MIPEITPPPILVRDLRVLPGFARPLPRVIPERSTPTGWAAKANPTAAMLAGASSPRVLSAVDLCLVEHRYLRNCLCATR